MQGLGHGKAVHGDICHLDAQVVGDIYSVETQGPARFQTGGLRPQLRPFGRGQEGDRGVLARGSTQTAWFGSASRILAPTTAVAKQSW